MKTPSETEVLRKVAHYLRSVRAQSHSDARWQAEEPAAAECLSLVETALSGHPGANAGQSERVRECLAEMVYMMDIGDESGAGSPWHIKATAALADCQQSPSPSAYDQPMPKLSPITGKDLWVVVDKTGQLKSKSFTSKKAAEVWIDQIWKDFPNSRPVLVEVKEIIP